MYIKIKILVLLFTLFLINAKVYSQGHVRKLISNLTNTDLKYDLIKSNYTDSFGKVIFKVPMVYVRIVSLNVDSVLNSVDSVTLIRELYSHLDDPNRDWYCNMILWSIFRQEGYKYIGIEGREEWVRYYKEEDLLDLKRLVIKTQD